jgi:hypothetical protein
MTEKQVARARARARARRNPVLKVQPRLKVGGRQRQGKGLLWPLCVLDKGLREEGGRGKGGVLYIKYID